MTDQVTLSIDDQEVTVPKGTLVLDAAAKLGIDIPIFCSHPKLDPVACCRMCLVEMSGPRGVALLPACAVPVAEGMGVSTNSQNVRDTQEAMLGFILLNHPLDCPICDKGGECPLQDQVMEYGSGISQLVEPKRHKNKDYMISDTIVLDQERCVICWRCIRYLEEWEDKPQLGLYERGGATLIDIQKGHPVDAKTGGNIIDICPVGALTNRVSRFNFRPWQVERTPSIDPHYSTGDNIRIDTRTHKIRRIIGRENMAVNDQWIADKTRFAYEWVNSEERLQQPLIRKEGELVPATWSEAIDFVRERLLEIKSRHGAEAIGGIGSTKLSNESNYLLQKFMRQVVGTNNIDHRNGGDVAAIPTGMPALADIMQPMYGPKPKVDTIMLFGIDPSEELPILDLHIKRAIRRGGTKVIIAHPRKTELTRYGGPYLGYRPGSEVTLLNVLTKLALTESGKKEAGLNKLLTGATLKALKEICGVDANEAKAAVKQLVESENALIIYGPMAARGASGADLLKGLTNLALVTDQVAGLSYIGLDANSQGCRDMGLLPNALPGHFGLENGEARARLEMLWDCQLPTAAGKSYKQMLDDAGESIKALYIMGADPASERAEWNANLEKLDLLVVQELFLTESAQKADVVLPAVSWAETNGTFTSCERRVQRAPKAVDNPKSKAAPDWMILEHLAYGMEAEWRYADAKAVLAEITHAVPQYDGLTWEALGDQGLQWDATSTRPVAAYRKAEQADLSALKPNGDNSFALVTGTVSYDGGNMFALTGQMHGISFGTSVAMNPADAERLGVDPDSAVVVGSAHGELSLTVRFDKQVQVGTLWIPESLGGAPVGSLLNGSEVVSVWVKTAQ